MNTCGDAGCPPLAAGARACHCASCHNTFGGLGLFDAHQDVDYARRPAVICRTPESIRVDLTGRVVAEGGLALVQDDAGAWQSPAGLAARQRNLAQLRKGQR